MYLCNRIITKKVVTKKNATWKTLSNVMSQMHGGYIPLDKMPPSFIGAISGVDKSVKSERYRNAMESLIKGFSQKKYDFRSLII